MNTFYHSAHGEAKQVVINGNGHIDMFCLDGTRYEGTGAVINSLGREEFMRRLVEFDGTLAEFQMHLDSKRAEADEEKKLYSAQLEAQKESRRRLILSGEIVPFNGEGIQALIEYLTDTNWGNWDKVNMAVAYKAEQRATEGGLVYVNVTFDNGVKVSNAPVNYMPKGFQTLRSIL